jgi:uncharacterized protein (DUF2141 family)
MRTAAFIAPILCLSATALGGQQRDANPRVVQAGTAVLSGLTLTTDEPARPLRRVLVTLAGAEVRGERQVMSDDEGRFAFDGLAAGRYTVRAEKPAYVTMHHGSPRPGFGPGTPVAVAEGQPAQVTFRIPRGAVIAGTIRAPGGQLLASAQAQLFRVLSVAGQLRTAPVPDVRNNIATDDKGRFRFYGLPPGDYVIRGLAGAGGEVQLTTDAELEAASKAIAQMARSGPAPLATPAPGPAIPKVRYAEMYAPNSVDLEGAQRFRVGLAQEMLDVDITVGLTRTARASIEFVGPDGTPVTDAMVAVLRGRTRSTWISPGGVRPDANGRSTLNGLPEGEWTVIGRASEPSSPQGPRLLFAETTFTMTGEDVTNVTLSFQRGSTIAGRVEIGGGGAIPPGLQLSLAPIRSDDGALAPEASMVQPDGSFMFASVAPGRYRIVASATPNLRLRSAMIGDVDTLDGSIDVEMRQDISGLHVVFTAQPTQLSGTLLDGFGRPAPEYAVIVFSTDRAHWGTAPRRMTGLVKLDSKGGYRITGLPPGTYYLSAVTDVDPLELGDVAFLEQLAAAALTITLKESEVKVQDLKIK